MIRYLFILLIGVMIAGCGSKTSTESFDPKSSPYFQAADALINIDGLSIRYRDEGPKDAQTLVMIHGFTSSLESWDSLAADLARDFRVLRLDLPGHGLTGPDIQARYTNEDTVKFMRAWLQELGIQNPVIIGNSLGGLVAWRYASDHTDSSKALVLIAPGGFSINGVTEDPVDVPMMVKFYLTKAPEAGVKQALQTLYGDASALPDERINAFRDMMRVPGNGDAFVQRAAKFTLPDPTEDLKKLDVPTLLLWGGKDIMVPVQHGEKFSTLMPRAKLINYESAGHIPQEEIPAQVAKDVRDFLSGLDQ